MSDGADVEDLRARIVLLEREIEQANEESSASRDIMHAAVRERDAARAQVEIARELLDRIGRMGTVVPAYREIVAFLGLDPSTTPRRLRCDYCGGLRPKP